jgi:hypothetical protein
MAWKKVELTEDEKKAGSGRPFKKFAAIGDKALGFFVKTEKKTANYTDGPKEETVYVLYGEVVGQDGAKSTCEFEITPPTDLKKKLEKAQRAVSDDGAGLQAGMGHLVQMAYTSTLKVEGRSDPMKIFGLAVDTEFVAKSPLPASVVWAKSRAPASSPPAGDDDIPF